MELRHLRYFVAVAEEGSFRQAAVKRLRMAQPSLSRQIQDLEGVVKVALINRGPRGIGLTPAGHVFLEHARQILAQADAAVKAVRRASVPAKTRFVVGFLAGQETSWLPRVLQVLGQEIETIELIVHRASSFELTRALESSTIDLAFLRPDHAATDLEFCPLLDEQVFAFMPASNLLTARYAIPPEALRAGSFIKVARSYAPLLRRVVDDYLHRCGVTPAPVHEADALPMVISLLQSTRGVTLLPAYMSRLLPEWVRHRPLAGSPPTIPLALGYNRNKVSSVLQHILAQQTVLAEPAA